MRLCSWLAITTAACSHPAPASQPAPLQQTADPSAARTGVVEGHITDADTDEKLPGVDVLFGSACVGGGEVQTALSDETGYYRIDLEPGRCGILARMGEQRIDHDIVIERGTVRRLDFVFAHEQVIAERRERPPVNCPSSKPATVIEGHTTSQADVDAVVAAVLRRFIADRGTMPDAHLLDPGPVRIDVEIAGRRNRALDPKQLPRGFVPTTQPQMQADADRTGKNISYLSFAYLDSDGSCAIVMTGADYTMPSKPHDMKLCCCAGYDVYEKRNGTWHFVKRLSTSCA